MKKKQVCCGLGRLHGGDNFSLDVEGQIESK